MIRAALACVLCISWLGCKHETGPAADLGSVDAAACAGATVSCGGACVDTSTSLAHCGACDSACEVYEQCVVGHCTTDETGGLTIASVGPATGYENGGAWLTVVGTGFANPLRAFIGTGRAPAMALDATHVRLLTPPGNKGVAAVHIEVAGKRATLPHGFTYDVFGLSSTWNKVKMSQARGGRPGAVVLQNGRVLIYGGTADSTSASASNTADLYDPSSKTTSLVPSTMVTARFDTNAVTLLDGRALIVGACNLPTGSPSCPISDGSISDLYEPATNTFAATPPKLADATRIAAKPTLLPDGRVLVISGANTSLEVFDPITSTFAMLAATTNAGAGLTARLRDGRVLLVAKPGGKSELFDPSDDTITVLAGTFEHAPQTVHVLPDGRAVCAGGGDLVVDDLTPHGAVQVYDPITGAFSTLGLSLKTPRTSFASVLASNGSLVIAGGQNSTYGLSTTGCDHVFPLLDSVEVVDPVSGMVTALAPIPDANFELRGISLFDGSLIVAGGSRCGGGLSIPFVYFLESAPVL